MSNRNATASDLRYLLNELKKDLDRIEKKVDYLYQPIKQLSSGTKKVYDLTNPEDLAAVSNSLDVPNGIFGK